MPKRFYLETSVIRSRLFGHSSIRNPLTDKLKNKTRITSKFVKMEFDKSIICDLIEFYFVLKNHNSIDDAIKWWAEEYKIRKLKNINVFIAEIFTGIEQNDTDRALFKLRNIIKTIIISFNCLIHRYDLNKTDCYFAKIELDFKNLEAREEIESALANFHKVFKDNYVNKCKIAHLIKDSEQVLKQITEFDSQKIGFITQKERLRKVVNGEKKLSCFSCRNIGDTVIALECPDYAVLLTQDKAFEDLCKIIGLKYEIIDSVRTILPQNAVLRNIT